LYEPSPLKKKSRDVRGGEEIAKKEHAARGLDRSILAGAEVLDKRVKGNSRQENPRNDSERRTLVGGVLKLRNRMYLRTLNPILARGKTQMRNGQIFGLSQADDLATSRVKKNEKGGVARLTGRHGHRGSRTDMQKPPVSDEYVEENASWDLIPSTMQEKKAWHIRGQGFARKGETQGKKKNLPGTVIARCILKNTDSCANGARE